MERGQASIEFVAVVPALVVCVLIAAQLGLAGHALWSAGVAARAGARAEHVGSDGVAAANRALPGVLREDAEISAGPPLRVRVRIPTLLPGLPPVKVSAATALEPDATSGPDG
jgi:hypothetical protein